MLYKDEILELFEKQYAKELIVDCFGTEAELYADDFKFTEAHIRKYHDSIIRNLEYIQGKTIVDLGSSTGLWPVLMYLNGAKSIICIEPRKQFSLGINNFSQRHNFPIQCINGFHTDIFTLNQKFDTVSMMGVDDIIVDIIPFLHNLRNVTDYILLKTANNDNLVGDNAIELKFEHNLYHRAGFSINQNNSDHPIGYESSLEEYTTELNKGKFLRFYYGKNFYKNLFDYLGYTILNDVSFYNENYTDTNYKCFTVKTNQF